MKKKYLIPLIVLFICLANPCFARQATAVEATKTTPSTTETSATPTPALRVQVKADKLIPRGFAGWAITPVTTALLQSAGRQASLIQPEENFALILPDAVWAGEPFTIQVSGKDLQKLAVNWRGKTLQAQAGLNGQSKDHITLLLSTLQKEKAKQLPLQLILNWKNGKTEIMKASLPVKIRELPIQRLTVNSKYVTPPASVLEKIKQDRAEMSAALSKSSAVKEWSLPLLRPVPGEVTSLYGLRRVFNGQERTPHRGIDFDADKGDPILACANGTVVLVGDHYYSGKIVVIDHGLEVFSMYLHLSEHKATVGQKVQRGEVVGLIGSTGRVTGPHLHFSLSVQGESVDAAPIMENMTKITKRATSGSEPVKKAASPKKVKASRQKTKK